MSELALDLADDEAVDAVARKHSAGYLKQRNPRLYRAIWKLVEYGVSAQEISLDLVDEHGHGVSRNLVAAVARDVARETDGDSVEHHKRRLLAGFRRLSLASVTRALELIESGVDVSLRDLAVMAGVATEKEQLLEGGPTHRVEHGVSAERQALRERLLRTPAPMVLEGGERVQMRGRAGESAPARVIEAETVTRDNETPDSNL